MKHKSIRHKTSILTLATSLLLAPLAMAADADNKTSKHDYSIDSVSERGQIQVNVGGMHMSIDELRGTNVINRQNENLGEIEDVVLSSNGSEATHVVVSTDNWFDGRTALIPVRSLEQADAETRDSFLANIRGGVVVLDMDEDRFEALASFKPGNDLEEYLENQADELAAELGIDKKEVFDDSRSYHTAVTNRSKEDRSDRERSNREYSSNQTDTEDWRESGAQQYRYNDNSKDLANRSFDIDGHSLTADELKGVEVVNHLDDRLGKVVDIIADENGNESAHLVVRTDDWFDGEHAIVPLSSIKYHANTDDPHPQDGANWWMGDHIVLNMTEEKFEELADYRRDVDPNSYIRANRDRLIDSYRIENSAIPARGTYYGFVYSVPYSTDSDSRSMEGQYSRNDKDMKSRDNKLPSKDEMIELGDSRIQVSKLEGKTVKAKNGKKVASVADVVADASSGEVEFLVLESKRNGEKTIIPVAAVESASRSKQHDRKGEACASWDGEALTLSSDASEFRSWATFKSQEEFESYLEQNADSLSEAFGIDESEIKGSNKDYVFLFEQSGYQTASR